MFWTDYYLAKMIMDCKIEEAMREIELRRLRQQAGLGWTAWLSRCGCWLLGRLGDALVDLGRRLQQYRVAQSTSVGAAAE